MFNNKKMNNNSNQLYRTAIQSIEECVALIDNSMFDESKRILFYDLLYRIHKNCDSLRRITNIEEDYLAVRLIQRSVLEDIITIHFFLSLINNDAEYNKALKVLNDKSKKPIEDWLKIHWEIDKYNANRKGEKYESRTEYLEDYHNYINTIDNITNDNLSEQTETRVNDNKFNGMPSGMKHCANKSEIQEFIRYLYVEYQFLSQVEHYSQLNRGFSYYNPNDCTITIHAMVITFYLKQLQGLIKEYM